MEMRFSTSWDWTKDCMLINVRTWREKMSPHKWAQFLRMQHTKLISIFSFTRFTELTSSVIDSNDASPLFRVMKCLIYLSGKENSTSRKWTEHNFLNRCLANGPSLHGSGEGATEINLPCFLFILPGSFIRVY